MDLERIRAAAERVTRSEGLEVVDVEWKIGRQRFLRVYIDRPWPPATPSGQDDGEAGAVGGISHADCERVSQQLSVILDVEELVPGPGYMRFKGRLAKISTAEPVGSATFFEGRLAGVADGKVRMELKGKEARVVELPLEAIRKAQLVVEF